MNMSYTHTQNAMRFASQWVPDCYNSRSKWKSSYQWLERNKGLFYAHYIARTQTVQQQLITHTNTNTRKCHTVVHVQPIWPKFLNKAHQPCWLYKHWYNAIHAAADTTHSIGKRSEKVEHGDTRLGLQCYTSTNSESVMYSQCLNCWFRPDMLRCTVHSSILN